jgi:glycosyltransferase involved in cell wall biosynthesis
LFAGTVGLRKGVPYLLEALRSLQGKIPFECKIAGTSEIAPDKLAQYRDVADFLGRVPRSQMNELYQWADVFVLPSICEGSAMVTYEALLSGLPVITTYNAGSLVRDGIDGYIVKIRDVEAIRDRLIQLYEVGIASQGQRERQQYIETVFVQAQERLRTVVCQF